MIPYISLLCVLVNRAARWVEVERNEMEIRLWEKKREGRDLPTFLSPPLIKFMYFNWSKLNFTISFYFLSFYLFLFISFLICFYFILFVYFSFYLCGSFGLLLFYWESITCQHAPRLLLVVTNDNRTEWVNRMCDLSTFPVVFGSILKR